MPLPECGLREQDLLFQSLARAGTPERAPLQSIKSAPKYSKHENWDWSDRACGEQVYDYYGVGPYSGW